MRPRQFDNWRKGGIRTAPQVAHLGLEFFSRRISIPSEAPLPARTSLGSELRQALGIAEFGLVFTPLFCVLCRKIEGHRMRVPRIRFAGEPADGYGASKTSRSGLESTA